MSADYWWNLNPACLEQFMQLNSNMLKASPIIEDPNQEHGKPIFSEK